MSFTTEWSVNCDHSDEASVALGGCEGSYGSAFSKAEVIEEAKTAGWLITQRRHYCPWCRQFYETKSKGNKK